MTFSTNELQIRYDTKVRKRLKEVFNNLVSYCKERHIPIAKEFRGDTGFCGFEKVADALNYRLGMVAQLVSDCVGLTQQNIRFALRSKGSKRVYRKGRPQYRAIKGLSDIKPLWNTKGFGVELDLYGWYYFIDRKNITLPVLYEKLTSGITIEEIFGQKNKRRYLLFNGVSMPQDKACKEAGICCRTFKRHVSGIDDDKERQRIFDNLLKLRDSITNYRNRWWVQVSEDDYNSLARIAELKNISPSELLHDILGHVKKSYDYE